MSFKTVDDVNRFVETTFRSNPVRYTAYLFSRSAIEPNDIKAICCYAIFTGPLGSDPAPTGPKDYSFAGAISLINTSRDDMVSELGYIQILKPFQVRADSIFSL